MIVATDAEGHIRKLQQVVRFQRNHVGDSPAVYIGAICALPVIQNQMPVATRQVRVVTRDCF